MLPRLRLLTVAAVCLSAAFTAPAVLGQADQPLPEPQFPDNNQLLPGQDILGKFLFWEEQLSHDNTMSCGTCHIHEAGGSDPRSGVPTHPGPDGLFGTDDDIHGSPGVVATDEDTGLIEPDAIFGAHIQATGRKSPPAINAWSFLGPGMFWDGRAGEAFTDPQTGIEEIDYGGALESQAAGPPVSPVEMATEGRTWDDITAKLVNVTPMALATDLPPEMVDFLADYPTYPAMFDAVYGDPSITSKGIIFAIANYERTLVSNETILDDFVSGAIDFFPTADQQAGFELFQGKANCATCHTLPLTMDNDFHNIGVRPDAEDNGKEAISLDPADRGRFKTPHLRNAKLRGNLFHNGSAATLADVVEFYNRGGDFNDGNLDPNILPLNLTETEKAQLVVFLEETMTDARVENRVFPFTRPTLRSELPSLNVRYGVESDTHDGQFPELVSHIPANIGNGNFLLGVIAPTPNTPVELVFAYGPDPAGTPFPDPRFPVPVNLDLSTLFLRVLTVADGNGVASFKLPLPKDPIIQGLKIYAQWFVQDVAMSDTGGVYGTEGVEIEIF